MPKKFKLKKELPGIPVGVIYEKKNSGGDYLIAPREYLHLHLSILCHPEMYPWFPDWFEEVKEEPGHKDLLDEDAEVESLRIKDTIRGLRALRELNEQHEKKIDEKICNEFCNDPNFAKETQEFWEGKKEEPELWFKLGDKIRMKDWEKDKWFCPDVKIGFYFIGKNSSNQTAQYSSCESQVPWEFYTEPKKKIKLAPALIRFQESVAWELTKYVYPSLEAAYEDYHGHFTPKIIWPAPPIDKDGFMEVDVDSDDGIKISGEITRIC